MKASLFVTCIVDQFYPHIGESTVALLNRFGVEVDFPKDQACCGQPLLNSGFWNDSIPLAKKFLEEFSDSEEEPIHFSSTKKRKRNNEDPIVTKKIKKEPVMPTTQESKPKNTNSTGDVSFITLINKMW